MMHRAPETTKDDGSPMLLVNECKPRSSNQTASKSEARLEMRIESEKPMLIFNSTGNNLHGYPSLKDRAERDERTEFVKRDSIIHYLDIYISSTI
jgi:hypothetical protein